jgi:uncharacterized protein involved in exopolysaccharide biosynthesis
MKRDTDHIVGVGVDVHRSPVHLPQGPENEISLIDLWLVLVRRRYWLLTVFAISVATAIAVSLLMSPRYESSAVLSLGQVQGLGVLEQPDILLERLKQVYHLGNADQRDRAPPYMESIELDTGASKRVFNFVAIGRTPEEARDFLHKAAEDLVTAHRRLYEEATQLQHEHVSVLDANLERFRQEADSLKVQRQHVKSLDASEAALVALERAKLVTSEPELETEKLKLRLALLSPGTEPTRLLQEPTLPKYASRPRPLLYIGIGVAMGLMLGLIAAVVAEFWAKARREMAARAVLAAK